MICGPGGATVARSTPDRKAACSNHVRVKIVTLLGSIFLPSYVSSHINVNARVHRLEVQRDIRVRSANCRSCHQS